ncbi:MAG TPA: amidohydrolase [Flavilitoribacter sp.]|nr:amidohydrolase [Flavilitoribacter sp.]HMQ88829.1 amidohydrolase [Flavilitoribacter sp.]
MKYLGVIFILAVLTSCKQQPMKKADILILNAKIWSDGLTEPYDAVAIKGDTILAVGFGDDLKAGIGPETRLIDAAGAFLCPGFIDSHVHFLQGGANLNSVQLRDADSPEEFIRRIAEFAKKAPADAWITGGDWNHELWGGELPDRNWIDSVTAGHPIFLNRLDGHMALANTKALELAGIKADTRDVPGGAIVRDAAGRITGIFKDNAMDVFYGIIPTAGPDEEDRDLQAAMEYVAGHGVTSVHHMGTFADLAVFERNRKSNKLITRIYAATPLGQWEELVKKTETDGHGDDWLHWGALKGFVDGSLGSHTAAFFEPFTDSPADTGLYVNTPENLRSWIMGADKAGLHVVVHAIGDRANNLILNIYEETEKADGPRDRRFRVEHAQHLKPGDIPRFAQLGVIPSMQPYHAIDDGCWAEKVIGPERCKTTYAFRSLLDAGATLAFGSDWFVAPPIPLEGIYAAVSRRTLDGKNPDGWVPEQKITVEEALRAYTSGAAYSAFEDSIKGRIEKGKLADLVLLDTDLIHADPDRIRSAKVLWTMVGGELVYEK